MAVLVLTMGCGDASPPAPVVQGAAASLVGAMEDTTHPYVVAVGMQMMGQEAIGCTGTIIAPDLVLTALHCTHEVAGTTGGAFCGPVGPQFQGMFIVAGERLKDGITDRVEVAEVITPCTDPCGCDVALLHLDGFVADPRGAVEPRLSGPIAIGEAMTAVGYGKVAESAPGAGIRRVREDVNVTCLGVTCGGLEISNNEFGTENVACGGDSGGPLLDAQGHVAGVLSRSTIPCEMPFGLAVYGSPRTHADWLVKEALAAAERDGHPAPPWTGAPQPPSVCEDGQHCRKAREWDGSFSDCGDCPTGKTCGFDTLCHDIPAPSGAAGAPPTGGVGVASASGMAGSLAAGASGTAGIDGVAGMLAPGLAPAAMGDGGGNTGCGIGSAGVRHPSVPWLWAALIACAYVARRRGRD